MQDNVQETVDLQMQNVSKYVDMLTEFGIEYGFQILGALVFLLIGLKVASWIGGRVSRMLEAKQIDVTLARFIGNVVKLIAIYSLSSSRWGTLGYPLHR